MGDRDDGDEILDLDALFQVGDIISMPFPHHTVPAELRDKFFHVVSVTNNVVKLSPPYDDAQCTVPYHPTPPVLRAGQIVPDE